MLAIYRAEREAGLAAQIQQNSWLAYAARLQLAERFALPEQTLSLLRASGARAQAALEDFDLHYLQDILVTTGWNDNEDVFDPVEVWIARATPEHKPFNYEHDCAQIIGHIVANTVIDAEGKLVSPESTVEELPDPFHVVTSSVLYKYWEKPELQERMDQVIAEIRENKWFVSMECLFKGFDYAIQRGSATSVVARNDKTAFLTKHLRAYGGTGTYQDLRVGRLLRNITFSGKGLVRKPANPTSVIFPAAKASRRLAAGVYVTETPLTTLSEIRPPMAHEITVESLQAELAQLKTENTTLQTSLREVDSKQVKIQLEAAQADKAQADQLLKAAQEQLTAWQSQVATLESSKTQLETTLAEVREELSGLYQSQKKAERLAKLKATLKVQETDSSAVEKARVLAESLEDLSDAKFEAALSSMSPPTNNPAAGNTSFPGPTPQLPPKGTPAPLPPQSTNLPAPARVPVGDRGAAATNSDPANLDAVEPSLAAAGLVLDTPQGGVSDVHKAIANYFGYEVEVDD